MRKTRNYAGSYLLLLLLLVTNSNYSSIRTSHGFLSSHVNVHSQRLLSSMSTSSVVLLNQKKSQSNIHNKQNRRRRRFVQTEHFIHDDSKSEDDDEKLERISTDQQTFVAKRNKFNKDGQAASMITDGIHNNNNGNYRRNRQRMHPMMRTDLTLEELEKVMNNRWSNGNELVSDKGSRNSGKNKSNNENDERMLQRVRTKQSKLIEQQQQYEYYDEDDEGYEAVPVIESGKMDENSVKVSNGGFFMRSNSEAVATDVASSIKVTSAKNSEMMSKEEKGYELRKKKKKSQQKKQRLVVTPLLDENGKEQYLTLDMATKQTEIALSSTDAVSLVEEKEDASTTIESFDELGITDTTILSNLEFMGCTKPLPVQKEACPPIVSGNDVLVGTHTGSGKTLAFMVPLVQKLLSSAIEEHEDNSISRSSGTFVKAIVVAPGRELASQIVSVSRKLLQGTGLNVALAIGGTPFGRNVEQIRKTKPDIIIGTPGRVAELIVGKDGER